MAVVSVEERWARDPRFGDNNDPYGNLSYQNYVAPNLAPKAADAAGVRPYQVVWRGAPPPPPDPFTQLFRWTLRNPIPAMVLAYTAWLIFWGMYWLRSF